MTSCLLVSACAPDQITVAHTGFDPFTRSYWTNVRGVLDMAGGERSELLCSSDEYGRLTNCWSAHGVGAWQAFVAGGLAGIAQGFGTAASGALIRPPRNETTVTTSEIGSNSGSVATSAPSVTASSRASNRAIGTGGQGAVAGATATGGNARAAGGTSNAASSANPTSSATSTGGNAAGGSSSAAATGGNPTATGGNPSATGGSATASPVATGGAAAAINGGGTECHGNCSP